MLVYYTLLIGIQSKFSTIWLPFTFTAVVLLQSLGIRAQAPPLSADSNLLTGTSFLDDDALIQAFHSKTFLKDNIPYIDIPDKDIQDVYYYR